MFFSSILAWKVSYIIRHAGLFTSRTKRAASAWQLLIEILIFARSLRTGLRIVDSKPNFLRIVFTQSRRP